VLARRIAEAADRQIFSDERPATVPASHYTSPAHFEREREAVFRRLPALVGHESELKNPGDVLPVEVGGVPLVLVRGADGQVRAFRNACRHRGTRLVRTPACGLKAMVCPYHAWTYDLTGKLTHVPHREAFCGEEASRDALVSAHAVAAHGFLWASLSPIDLPAFLAELQPDLETLGAERWVPFRQHVRDVAANWKLMVDAFLEGYHIKFLHRESVGRFFLDSAGFADRLGDHMRAATVRREFKTNPGGDPLAISTPSYLVFPSTTLVLHPDFYSVITLTPLAADRTRFSHAMFVDAAPRTPKEEAHFSDSFALIDGRVFGTEDIGVCQEIQQGLAAQADEALLFGQLEVAALWFHAQLKARLDAQR
jgi:phenylpropionate dioxygenase-like ring-hydroxylating dioxygenase large terminal subunit